MSHVFKCSVYYVCTNSSVDRCLTLQNIWLAYEKCQITIDIFVMFFFFSFKQVEKLSNNQSYFICIHFNDK